MNKPFYSGLKLGILGGGQLGRMLIQSCVDLNVHTLVLDPDPEAPCKGISHEFINGSFKDAETVFKFGCKADVITIEIEHVNVDALEKLQEEGKIVYPQPHVIRIVQDKGLQKQFFKENDIPSSDFVLIDDRHNIAEHKSFLPAFQKVRTSGYDGRGVKAINTENDIETALEGPALLEKKVDFLKEISVIVARGVNGEISVFPAVDMILHPEKNLLSYLAAPAELSNELTEKANEVAKKVAEKLEIVGILAVEMFITKDGEVLVNEIAPRPHNSGHHTIEANYTSQYEQHLRAILGLPLGPAEAIVPAAMINLLGEEGYEGEAFYEGIEKALKIPGVHIHLYGKTQTKPYRKMGHVTVIGKELSEVHKKANQVLQILKVKAF
jgi:5-(carboxyamino)imidazole ribonucleotide synthase